MIRSGNAISRVAESFRFSTGSCLLGMHWLPLLYGDSRVDTNDEVLHDPDGLVPSAVLVLGNLGLCWIRNLSMPGHRAGYASACDDSKPIWRGRFSAVAKKD